MAKFNLSNYMSEIRAVSLDKFLINLAVMKEQNPGASQLNFHELGQEWNKLPSAERLEQRETVERMLNRPSRTNRGE